MHLPPQSVHWLLTRRCMKGRCHRSLYTRSSTADSRRFHRSHNLCTCSSLAGVRRCQRRRSAYTPSPATSALLQSLHLFIRRCRRCHTACRTAYPHNSLCPWSPADGVRRGSVPRGLLGCRRLWHQSRGLAQWIGSTVHNPLYDLVTLLIRPLTFCTFLQHSLLARTATGLSAV